jgi:adenine-specific DNA-methyltransferase
LATCHEYLLIFSKTVLPKGSLDVPKSEEEIAEDYPEKNDNGVYRELELRNTHRDFGKHNRPNLYYPFYVLNDGTLSLNKVEGAIEIRPDWDDGFEGCWTWGKEKAADEMQELVAYKVKGNWKVYRNAYPTKKQLKSVWAEKRHHTEKGQTAFNELFNVKEKIFQSPKSLDVLRDAISMTQDKNAIILDFFAGSGTLAHAVLAQNNEDDGKRKFILVQLPEPTPEDSEARKAGYKTISDICKERIRKAIKKIKEERAQNKPNEKSIDLGFKSFRLTKSNCFVWDEDAISDKETLAKHIGASAQGASLASEDALLFELMLREGLKLDSGIEQITEGKNKFYKVTDDAHILWMCFDESLDENAVEKLSLSKDDKLIVLDSALTDTQKVNLTRKSRIETV